VSIRRLHGAWLYVRAEPEQAAVHPVVACLVRAESGGSATVSCPPDEKTKFVCGVVNSEDIGSIAEDSLGHQ